MAGVSKAALTRPTKPGGKLFAAVDGDWVDLDHPAVVEWLREHGVEPTAPRPRGAKRRDRLPVDRPGTAKIADPPPAEPAVDVDGVHRATSAESARAYLAGIGAQLKIEGLPGMTLQELIERYGTEAKFRDFLDARKRIGEIIEKDLKNEETQGRLIEREFVRTHVLSLIDSAFTRLLRDTATNIARTLQTMVRLGESNEVIEKRVCELIGEQINDLKADAVRALNNA